ncbi:MAG: hypothetical protein COB37_02250 [Kordiimonadales bacterium]|nr:MAG: hypothetical protein COB37_02250 [Kordiimonadales bacterium]
MTDYSFFINSAYGLSGVALFLMAALSYRGMKRNEQEAATLRRRRKEATAADANRDTVENEAQS